MAISRQNLAKELEPGLNALFGMEYKQYDNQHTEIFDTESSIRAFEEEQMLGGFATAPEKPEGTRVASDEAGETYTARYEMVTIALSFSLTEEAVEDNLYGSLSRRYTKALARSMSQTKQIRAASVLNNAFNTSYPIGDGGALCESTHPTLSGDKSNVLSTAADFNETSLEQMLIDIAGTLDERGNRIALNGRKLIIPKELQFVAERVINSNLRSGTADNDLNASKSLGMLPDGACVNNFLTDVDAWFIKTDCPNGFKHFERIKIKTGMEGDFDTGNLRFKARERYTFGVSDWRCVRGTPGAA